MNTQAQNIPGAVVTSTRMTKLAAALVTVGSTLRKQNPITNVYANGQEFVPGKPGDVYYHFDGQQRHDPTSGADVTAQQLADAWEKNTAHADLDTELDAFALILAKHGVGIAEFAKLRKTLVYAVMCYMRAGMENRERLLDLWRKAAPLRYTRKANNAFVLTRARQGDTDKI